MIKRVRQKGERQTFLQKGLVEAKSSSRNMFQSATPDVCGTARSNKNRW